MTREFTMKILIPSILFALTAPTPAQDLGTVLEKARQAAHRTAWDGLGGDLRLEGRFDVFATESEITLDMAPGGEFRMVVEGPLGSTHAWNGETLVTREGGGPVRELAFTDREAMLLAQWLHSGYWLEAELELTLLEESAEGIALEAALPGSGRSSRVVLDRETHLPHTLHMTSNQEGGATWSFLDYQEVRGVPIAQIVERQEGSSLGRVTLVEATVLGKGEADYTLQRRLPEDTSFDPEVSGDLEVRRASSGHVLVRPLVHGLDVGWFILDSGAGQSCIDSAIAEDLEMPVLGNVPAVGVAGVVETSFRQASSLELGPLTFANPVLVELDLAFLEQAFGFPVGGIIGHDVFARSVIEFDLRTPSASIHDPRSYTLSRGEWTPVRFQGRIPVIECSFEGDRRGSFNLDTGANGNLVFHTHAVHELGLLEGRAVTASQSGGVGGSSPATTGRIEWFEIGGRRLENLPVTFSQTKVGVQSERSLLGSLGGGVLGTFVLVFDYPRGQIAFVPRDA